MPMTKAVISVVSTPIRTVKVPLEIKIDIKIK